MEEIIELVHTEIITSGYHKKLAAGIVVTGGGSQLTNLSQLFEYMTGLDTRIGYPNEHLGKSKVDAAKSPMYATTVGLVLSGFKALDIREARYRETSGGMEVKKRGKQSNKFFSNILERTKGLLIDDFDDKLN
jgi:cell division protein FtsA